MPIEFTTLQRETLTAIVDTFVASVPHENDPDGFYAAKGSDVGADLATEQYLLTHLPEEQLAGLLQLIDGAVLFEFKDQPQAVREEILANFATISPEAAGAIAALNQLSVLFAYGLPGPDGRNPLWAGMEYPGPAQNPPQDSRKTLEVITVCGETTLDADVVVVGSGSGGGVAAAALAEAGRRVIILEAGSYYNESDFVQSEVAAYQKLFLRGGFFPSADGMVSIAAGSTVGGGSTVNWSNSLLTPNTVRSHWVKAGLTDVDTPAFDEHLQAVFERIRCNDKVATQNGPHERLSDGASQLGYSYRVANLNIDPEKYDPNLIGYSGMGDQTGAKQGTMRTYLQDASDAGAKLLARHRMDADRRIHRRTCAENIRGSVRCGACIAHAALRLGALCDRRGAAGAMADVFRAELLLGLVRDRAGTADPRYFEGNCMVATGRLFPRSCGDRRGRVISPARAENASARARPGAGVVGDLSGRGADRECPYRCELRVSFPSAGAAFDAGFFPG